MAFNPPRDAVVRAGDDVAGPGRPQRVQALEERVTV
jgi:hypothetical protein